MTAKIAIIGSGPSGIYAMDGALKYIENCQIDILDRLPTPFGLVRAGVAPDHLGTKNVINQYEKAIGKGDVAYFGNITVGHDVTLNELHKLYDAIIIATGATIDKNLGIPGEDLEGVYGSAEFVGWYNGHPDYVQLAPDFSGKSVVVIGNGNVSLDIARLLVKTPKEREDSDIHKAAAELFDSSNFKDVYVVGRRGPLQTSFTPPELRELGRLTNACPVIDKNLLTAVEIDDSTSSGRVLKKVQEIFSSFTEIEEVEAKSHAHLIFLASPVEIIGTKKVRSVRFEKNRMDGNKAIGTGEFFEIKADLVIKAIGYKSAQIEGALYDEISGRFSNIDGKISDNLYVVGWGKRGPSGTIPTNRPDSFLVAQKVAESLSPSNKKGREGLENLIKEKSLNVTSFSDWKKLDLEEINRTISPKPREKFISLSEMLNYIDHH